MGGGVMSGEHYPVLWIGRTAVVSLPAEIDITNADQVREDLLSVLNRGAVLLIADLSRTTFCDSAGVSAVARSFRRAEASQSDMRLVVGTLAVQRCWRLPVLIAFWTFIRAWPWRSRLHLIPGLPRPPWIPMAEPPREIITLF
jgi:anti-sigma B factor antagonist